MSPRPKCLVITGALDSSIVNSSRQQRLSSPSPSRAAEEGRQQRRSCDRRASARLIRLHSRLCGLCNQAPCTGEHGGKTWLFAAGNAVIRVRDHLRRPLGMCTQPGTHTHTDTWLFQSGLLLMEELLRYQWSKDGCSHRTFLPATSNKIKQNIN